MAKQTGKYWLHGSCGENLHYQTNDIEQAKKYADSFTSKTTVSLIKNGLSPWNGKPCKMFELIYTNKH